MPQEKKEKEKQKPGHVEKLDPVELFLRNQYLEQLVLDLEDASIGEEARWRTRLLLAQRLLERQDRILEKVLHLLELRQLLDANDIEGLKALVSSFQAGSAAEIAIGETWNKQPVTASDLVSPNSTPTSIAENAGSPNNIKPRDEEFLPGERPPPKKNTLH